MLLAVLAPCLVYAANPGATASLDIGVVDQAKDVYFNYIMNILKNVQIPDISFHHGYIHENTFFVTESAQNVQITNDPTNNGVRLEIDDLQAGFQSKHLRYKVSFITAKGSVEAQFSHVKLAATVGITQQTLADGKKVPAFTVKNIDVDMPKDHISIKLHGNLVVKIASAFKSLFMGTIRDEITKALKDNLAKQLPPVLNKLVASQDGHTEIYKGLDLDWTTPTTPQVTAKQLQFGVKGLFFKDGEGEVEPSVAAPAMPMHDDAAEAKFQAFISNYLLDSFATTFLKVQDVHFWTKSKDIPSSSPVKFTTSGLNLFFPGLEAHYGKDKPVDIEYRLDRVGNFIMKEADQTLGLDGDVHVKFWVETNDTAKDCAVDIVAEKVQFALSALILNDTQVYLSVSNIAIGDIKIVSTTFGNLDLQLLADCLNKVFDIAKPYLNEYLESLKLAIPEQLFGIFKLSNIDLKYHDGYIEAGLTPTFVPPKVDIPGFYEKFVPQIPPEMDDPSYVFEEVIDENGNYSSRMLREQVLADTFVNQMAAREERPTFMI